MKIVISDPKTGKSYQKEIEDEKLGFLTGKIIGDKIDGNLIELANYEFIITGGSDKSGFPMRPDFIGQNKKKLLLSGGVGYNCKEKGIRRKKTVRGNKVSLELAQLNLKIIKHGNINLEEAMPKTEKK